MRPRIVATPRFIQLHSHYPRVRLYRPPNSHPTPRLTHRLPSDSGYTKIYSTAAAFAAVKADGSITAWGSWNEGGTGAPSGNGYTKIYSNWNTLIHL
jgi:hypothetical protein